MNILVCVKQVTDSESAITINQDQNWIKVDDYATLRMNRFDEFAVEEAIRIKESFSGVTIHAISVGPQRVSSTIKRAMEMGADFGIHVLVDEEKYLPPYQVASLIVNASKDINYDLILTGVMAEDDMQCMVGQTIAGMLDIPFASSCIQQKLDQDCKKVYIHREIEQGKRAECELELPALLTIQPGINTPRYPSLSNVLRTRKQELQIIEADSIHESRESETLGGEALVKISYPEKTGSSTIIEGTPKEKAIKILEILYQESVLK